MSILFRLRPLIWSVKERIRRAVAWVDLWDVPCGLSDCDPVTWTGVPVVTVCLFLPSQRWLRCVKVFPWIQTKRALTKCALRGRREVRKAKSCFRSSDKERRGLHRQCGEMRGATERVGLWCWRGLAWRPGRKWCI